VEKISLTEEKTVIPENHRKVIGIPVPIEVEEIAYPPAELNPTSISWMNTYLKIDATQMPHSSGKFKILGFNAIKDREETLRAG
jgi:hypothetical protein